MFLVGHRDHDAAQVGQAAQAGEQAGQRVGGHVEGHHDGVDRAFAQLGGQRGADGGTVARQELHHLGRHAGVVQQLHCVVADQRPGPGRSPAGSSTG
ncbi:hypothetical protein G6F23_015216 [Rhizopus arrhizus]|nr:hypothetical protein G6F23_015216 [Rhizopus arrhizus]